MSSTSEQKRDALGHEVHDERLRHASRFCKAVFDVEPSLRADGCGAQKVPCIHSDRSRLTLTFAQSCDGMIAGKEKKMLALSNAESMIMTHSLRVLHDAILIGVGTACNDNPQLNARLLTPLLDGSLPPTSWLPRPIVVDRALRLPTSSKLLLNYANGTGRQPLILGAEQAGTAEAERLRAAGAEVVLLNTDTDSWLYWPALLKYLKSTQAIDSVMVEGGARVIDDLLASHEEHPIIDDLIVTIAPCIVGEYGLAYRRPKWLEVEGHAKPKGAQHKYSKFAFKDDVVAVWQYR